MVGPWLKYTEVRADLNIKISRPLRLAIVIICGHVLFCDVPKRFPKAPEIARTLLEFG